MKKNCTKATAFFRVIRHHSSSNAWNLKTETFQAHIDAQNQAVDDTASKMRAQAVMQVLHKKLRDQHVSQWLREWNRQNRCDMFQAFESHGQGVRSIERETSLGIEGDHYAELDTSFFDSASFADSVTFRNSSNGLNTLKAISLKLLLHQITTRQSGLLPSLHIPCRHPIHLTHHFLNLSNNSISYYVALRHCPSLQKTSSVSYFLHFTALCLTRCELDTRADSIDSKGVFQFRERRLKLVKSRRRRSRSEKTFDAIQKAKCLLWPFDLHTRWQMVWTLCN
ncbi:unnamed protein product [Albugo candida]|uniref:Uncharacterized protein n=1 Tax=Albugo candida TaxID=65357 RepID=A0A024FW41_9STRA|nr:unnamed protein product [Albugo candida]|eukprot:CCI11340.1 unnamed protein product [Albugo candida]